MSQQQQQQPSALMMLEAILKSIPMTELDRKKINRVLQPALAAETKLPQQEQK